MSNYIAKAVDTQGCSIGEATAALQEALNEMAVVITVSQVGFPYSLPDPDSSYRDFHYTDSGFIIVGIPKP